MKKIKIGVFGASRGTSMIRYCEAAGNAELVAICDKWQAALDNHRAYQGDSCSYYTDFDSFLKHDMDAVVIANYAHEHVPYAIKALEAGKHVYSEVVAASNMQQAVALVEAVEKSDKIYAYGENHCYMRAPYEMRLLYREGRIGEFEYGECEYIHNLESVWPGVSYGDPNHWRNNRHAFFYCTHSIGPMIHITGLRPVSVVGFEGTKIERHLRMGAKGGQFGIEMITMDNGGIIKSIHGDLYKRSTWFSLYGGKGRMESARYDSQNGGTNRIFINSDDYSGAYDTEKLETYEPQHEFHEQSRGYGHGGSDFYTMYNFVEKLLGNPKADTIDVYEAMDMTLPGMFAFRSAMAGSIPMEIPNLRDKSVRDQWRNDTTCSFPDIAGDMFVPAFASGKIEIPDEVYENIRSKWNNQPRAKYKQTK